MLQQWNLLEESVVNEISWSQKETVHKSYTQEFQKVHIIAEILT